MHLVRLVYASTARPDLGLKDLAAILQSADAANSALGITGMLCHGCGAFLQVLEGRRGRVNELFGRIGKDDRHANVELLEYSAIDKLSFGDWPMRFIGVDDALTSERRAILQRHVGQTTFEPHKMTGTQAYVLLRALAQLERDKAVSLRSSIPVSARTAKAAQPG
jgi:hypothetical protein